MPESACKTKPNLNHIKGHLEEYRSHLESQKSISRINNNVPAEIANIQGIRCIRDMGKETSRERISLG